jgi:alkanesulfonate monooxygenase SsuD/methylene tetrahydromethanopterin reductase-like flavin-dependent oxidoreductase (luciferase family)
VRHGVNIPNMGSARRLVALARDAESAGWDGVFLWDHMHFFRAAGNDVVDPWVVLGAMAQVTERVRLGTMVTPVARRRPWKLAKEIVTLDHLSGGRVIAGVGLGEPADDEFAAFGENPDARVRAGKLDEGLALLDRFLRGEPVQHEGVHFRVDAELRPAAVQRPRPPIWVAGKWPNRRPFRRAMAWDGVYPIGTDTQPLLPASIAEISAFVASAGIDVVASPVPGVPAAEFAAAGATWLVAYGVPIGDWQDDIERVIRKGPPR